MALGVLRVFSHLVSDSLFSPPPPPKSDVNECAGEAEEPVCTGANEACENTDGSYRCICAEGYVRKEGICEEDKPPGKS